MNGPCQVHWVLSYVFAIIIYTVLVLLIADAVYLCILKSKHMLSHTIGCLICYRVKIYRYMFIWGGACAINMLFIILIIFGLFFVIIKIKVISFISFGECLLFFLFESLHHNHFTFFVRMKIAKYTLQKQSVLDMIMGDKYLLSIHLLNIKYSAI